MFTLYTVLLTLHILFVVGWLGASVTLQVISHHAKDDPAWPPLMNAFAGPWFPAVGGLAALTGVLMWIDGDYDFGTLWILIAVAGWIASSAIGATRLNALSERWSQGDTAARTMFLQVARVDAMILVLIVADMVIKPHF